MWTDLSIFTFLKSEGIDVEVPKKKVKRKKKRMPTKNRTEYGWKFPDGREVCDEKTYAGREEYRTRTNFMWMRDEGKCCICRKPLAMAEATFEYKIGRGMNGSHRDDRTEGNGVAHWNCNSEKGSKRI